MERALQAQEHGRKFLQQTLQRRMKTKEAEGGQRRTEQEKRMRAVAGLKESIESSWGTLQAQQLLQRERERRARKEEEQAREAILEAGGNPHQEFLRRKRVSEYEEKRAEFARKQHEAKVEIVARLLEEERQLSRAQHQGARAHWKGRGQEGRGQVSVPPPLHYTSLYCSVPHVPRCHTPQRRDYSSVQNCKLCPPRT